MKYYSFPVDPAPTRQAGDSAIRMGCVTEGIDRQEMVSSLQCSGNVSWAGHASRLVHVS